MENIQLKTQKVKYEYNFPEGIVEYVDNKTWHAILSLVSIDAS